MKKYAPYYSWFLYFFLYNLLFFALQLGFIYSKSHSFINAIPLPVSIYFQLIGTLFIHLGLYFLLAVTQTILMWGSTKRVTTYHEQLHIIIWTLSVIALLSTNGYFFPLSLFSRLFLPELPLMVLIVCMIGSLTLLCLFLLNALFYACQDYPKTIGALSILLFAFYIYGTISPQLERHLAKKPNIIFIGVDSLNPRYVNTAYMPTLARFAENGVLFKETISPLAHTYPAWSSILTGLYPHHHRASYNLMPPDVVKSSFSIAWSLQEAGYQTLFATDDRRFNNIGEDFGFQTIIGPKMGVNDMLLGTFNDFPLSNLIVNLPISQWLFPYNYINRASHYTYYPQSFDAQLRATLLSRPSTTPLFLAVHFTLPHWPYAWAASSPADVGDEYSLAEREQLYLAALKRVDKQVSNLLRELKQQGYLENSMVVLLSDHGEALYAKGSRKTNALLYQGQEPSVFADYLKRKTSTALDMSVGHGSDLLSPDQYQCLLAFKIYKDGHLITKPKQIKTRVALFDLAPTVRSFTGLLTPKQTDGISLLPSIMGKNILTPRRFIMESGMLPNQFLNREKAKVLGQKFFTVHTRTGLLEVKKQELATLDSMKLYAVIQDNWLLALYPDDKVYLPIILNLTNEEWSDNLNTSFSKKSPALSMLNALQQFYHTSWLLN